MEFNIKAIELVEKSQIKTQRLFKKIDKIAFDNQLKVLRAFQEHGIQLRHFNPTSGYGYDDTGRESLGKVFATTFGAETAIVSPLIASGTHALTIALFGILRPNDTLLSITGAPYDTLMEVINGNNVGSLKDFQVQYKQVGLKNNTIDIKSVVKILKMEKIKLIFIGRSRGYEWRDALSISDIQKAISAIRQVSQDVTIMVDNCYGEFMEELEPTQVGANVIVGSLIKNPGGGIAPTGGYIAGDSKIIEQISYRLTAPSIGIEVGSYNSSYAPFYQGFFLAPHVTANAVKGSVLLGQVFSDLGYETMPSPNAVPKDIIRSVKFNTETELTEFCRAIQEASPVDSNVVPYPWDMPGYNNPVIMAAGTFIQGASIELSADSPIKKPYIAYMQGGLTFEHVKIATISAVSKIIKF